MNSTATSCAMITTTIIVIIFTLIFVCCDVYRLKEGYDVHHAPPATYLRKRTSCFSCERSFPAGQEWRGQPSKCFDCEKESANPFYASRTVS